MGWVLNVILINVYLGLENPGGVGILGGRVYEPGEGMGKFSLRATWERGERILSQQGGFQVSRERGAKGSKGKYAMYIIHVSFVHIVECLE
jgi:hypothetical protein